MTNIRRFRKKTHKKHTKKNASHKRQSAHAKIYKGGLGEAYGFPQCTILSQFQMSDQSLTNFARHFKSPSDCFISALQLFGIVDVRSANLMRISSAGRSGVSIPQIETTFIYLLGNNFCYKPTNNYDEFTHWIQTLLNPGHAVLAGYKGLPPNASGVSSNVPGGHVFVIAKTDNNTIIYIDPQVPPDGMICDVSQCENTFLRNKQGPWYLLFNSAEKISDIQQQQIVEYVATG